jgi:hypothetical protein
LTYFLRTAAIAAGALRRGTGAGARSGRERRRGAFPQPIIERFLAFEITPEFQQMYGYPALTTAVKAKILGLNAARAYGINVNAVRCGIQASQLARLKLELDGEFGERRWALQQPMLRTRRDFLQHVGLHKALGRPG